MMQRAIYLVALRSLLLVKPVQCCDVLLLLGPASGRRPCCAAQSAWELGSIFALLLAAALGLFAEFLVHLLCATCCTWWLV